MFHFNIFYFITEKIWYNIITNYLIYQINSESNSIN